MSEDARNSIFLWVGALGMALVFWIVFRFELLSGMRDEWLEGLFLVLMGILVVDLLRLLRNRSADARKVKNRD